MANDGLVGKAFVQIGVLLSPLRAGFKVALGLTKAFSVSAGKVIGASGYIGKGLGLSIAAGLTAARGSVIGLGNLITGTLGGLKSVALGAGLGIAGALGAAIPLVKIASDVSEMESKFKTVFGNQAESAEKFAKDFGGAVGRSTNELKGFLAETQNLMVPLGFSREEANGLSQTMTRLAVDIGSFQNMSDRDALDKLTAGVLGSHEVLKPMGIVINDNILSLKLHAMGLAKDAQHATEQQKAMARLQIVMESTRDSQGDAAKTSGGLANSWKGLMGSLYDLGATLGATLQPAALAVVEGLSGMAEWVTTNIGMFTSMGEMASGAFMFILESMAPVFQWLGALAQSMFQFGFQGSQSFTVIGSMISSILPSFATVKSWVESLVFAFLNWDLTVKTIGLNLAQTFANMWGRIQNFGSNAVTLVTWIGDNWSDILFSVIDYVLTGFMNLGKNIRTIFFAVIDAIRKGSIKPLTDAFSSGLVSLGEGAQSAISKLPDFKPFQAVDMSSEFSQLDREWDAAASRWTEVLAKNAPKMGEAVANPIASSLKSAFSGQMNLDLSKFNLKKDANKKGSGDKSNVGEKSSLSSAYDKLQKAALSGKPDDTPKLSLKTQREMLKSQRATERAIRDQKKMAARFA